MKPIQKKGMLRLGKRAIANLNDAEQKLIIAGGNEAVTETRSQCVTTIWTNSIACETFWCGLTIGCF